MGRRTGIPPLSTDCFPPFSLLLAPVPSLPPNTPLLSRGQDLQTQASLRNLPLQVMSWSGGVLRFRRGHWRHFLQESPERNVIPLLESRPVRPLRSRGAGGCLFLWEEAARHWEAGDPELESPLSPAPAGWRRGSLHLGSLGFLLRRSVSRWASRAAMHAHCAS